MISSVESRRPYCRMSEKWHHPAELAIVAERGAPELHEVELEAVRLARVHDLHEVDLARDRLPVLGVDDGQLAGFQVRLEGSIRNRVRAAIGRGDVVERQGAIFARDDRGGGQGGAYDTRLRRAASI